MKRFGCIFWVLIQLLANQAYAQSQGPNSGSIFANNASTGTIAWNNPSNASASDGVYATAGALALGNNTNYLTATGFGFSIPLTATIKGVTVSVQKAASGLFENVTDNAVNLVVGGLIAGTNHASGITWPTSEAYSTYGSATDTWGLVLTPLLVNAANFGFAISASLNGLGVLPSAKIDYIKITVSYVIPMPVELLNFTAGGNQQTVDITWSTATEVNSHYFTVEKAGEDREFSTLSVVDASGNSTAIHEYSLTDNDPIPGISYYRLKETDFDGTETILSTKAVEEKKSLSFYPNPLKSGQVLFISASSVLNELPVQVLDRSGKVILKTTAINCNLNTYSINLSPLPHLNTGNYLLMVDTGTKSICVNLVIAE